MKMVCRLLGQLCAYAIFAGSACEYSAYVQATELETKVDGLQQPVEIRIDSWGVPHIYAASQQDAFFAQGWNAARDRLWQIDLWRRSGLGELSAVRGRAYLAQDRAIRLFVYRGNMDAEWEAYGVGAQRHTEAFVAGINAYVAAARANPDLMPMEFRVAGYEPAFWKAEDVVRVRNHGLAGSVFSEVSRAQAACAASSMKATEIAFRISPSWTPVIPQGLDLCSVPADVLSQYVLAQKPMSFGDEAEHGASAVTRGHSERAAPADPEIAPQGSNNWVIAPSKTTTGRPILANDPHRSLDVPSLRYIAHLVAPGLDVIGSGEPALPGIAIGHNKHIAFGITVFPIAQEDLYVYDTRPGHPDQYRYRGQWENMKVIHETIPVRGERAVQADLKFTRHGPIVYEDPAHNRAYAVRAAWLDTGGAPYMGSLSYLLAKNVTQFADALRHWGSPGENQIYADTSGTIGWFPVGFTPVRNNSDGLLPLPGDGRYEWGDYLSRAQLPSEINPVRGYIATANQMDLPKSYPYEKKRISFSWADDYRFDRISQVIENLPKVSVEDSQRLQNDLLSLPAVRLMHLLQQIRAKDPNLQDIVDWLGAWDGQIRAESPQAALFEVWVAHHLGSAVISRVLPQASEELRWTSGSSQAIVELLERPDRRLGHDPISDRDQILIETLSAAVDEMKRRQGIDRTRWAWGKLSTILFEHPLSSAANKSVGELMNVGPAPKSGDGTVVGLAAYSPSDFRVVVGPSFRMVLDVGNWDQSAVVNAPGQSGNSTSSHYRDLFPLWLNGRYFPLAYSRAAVEKMTDTVITLLPQR